MLNSFEIEIPNDGVGNATVGSSKAYSIPDRVCAFSFVRGGAAAFTGNLEVSIGGQIWSTLQSMAASAEGEIDPYYRFVRATVTGAGALGDSEAWYHGKD